MKNILKKTAGVMLATSMICAIMTTGCTADEDNTASDNSKLVQQTLVDEITGIEVSGKLPVGAKLDSMIYFIDDFMVSESFDSLYVMEEDYPKVTEIPDYDFAQGEKRIDNFSKIINTKGWAGFEGYAGGKLDVRVSIVKDSKVLDVDSDLIVTLPFNYRRGLVTGGITDEATVVQYDYDNQKFVESELVSVEETPKGMFQFKTNSAGQFFVGGEEEISRFVSLYTPGAEY